VGAKKRRSYKPLPKEFRHNGFRYRHNPSVSYEVIRIRRRDGFQIGSRFVEPAEVYLRSELWGTNGFTFTNRDKAFAKFSEISLEEPARTERR